MSPRYDVFTRRYGRAQARSAAGAPKLVSKPPGAGCDGAHVPAVRAKFAVPERACVQAPTARGSGPHQATGLVPIQSPS